MDERRNRMDEPTDEEIAERLTNSLFGEADTEEADEAPAPETGGAAADASDMDAAFEPGEHAAPDRQDAPQAGDGMITPARDASGYDAWEDAAEMDFDADDGYVLDAPDASCDGGKRPKQNRRSGRAGAPSSRVEAFVPTEAFYDETPRRKKKKHHRTRRSYVWIVLALLGAVLLAAGGVYLYNVRYNPGSFFGASASGVTPTPSAAAVTEQADISAAETPGPTPAPTLDPYAALVAQADTSMMQNIVNILVVGVDYAEERETWNGKKEWHSDVMMLLAVNFDENRADLISLPRDTYANIPGVKGIYKLNAAINCGGGMDAPGGAGFLKVCEAASWMLGGIPVNYYYAVTMPAVKGLVDAVGGVDYDLEMSYTMMGRRYRKGQQHLDGQGVLDYLRVRKNVSASGDGNRVNRQKKMMVALFETMQQQNLILKIPDILGSFDGQLFTNCTLSQTAALASFAYNLDKENIGMYSMSSKGGGNTNIFNWNFCLTDQANRVKIIKTVYGIDVPEERAYSSTYAKYRWAEMRAEKYLNTCNKLINYTADYIANGQLYIEPEIPMYPDSNLPIDPNVPIDPAPPTNPTMPGGPSITDGGGETGGIPDGGAVGFNNFSATRYGIRLNAVLLQQYTQGGLDLYNSLRRQVNDFEEIRKKAARQAEKYLNGGDNSFSSASGAFTSALDSLQNTATEVASAFGYGSLNWSVRYEKDTGFNEVTVDFN